MRLPDFLDRMLAEPPRTGEGVHNWLFKVARQLHAHWPAPQIADALAERVARCGRPVLRTEIEAAVANSIRAAWRPRGEIAPPYAPRTWPELNRERRNAIIATGGGLADLWEASPYRFEDNDVHAEAVVDALFPGNPLLCCAWTKTRFDTRPREEWRGQLSGLAQIVPSAMVALKGRTQAGHESAHALSNTGPRQYIVTEFDAGTLDEQAALLLHLADLEPLACVVHSGNKSLHGWFYCAGAPEDSVRHFFRYAVALGADSALWTRSQFARMPDGRRDTGQRQVCYFLNPATVKGSQ